MRDPSLHPPTSMPAAPRALGYQRITLLAAAYGAWLIASLAGIGLLLLWHSALLQAFIHFHLNGWAFALYSDVVVIIFALVWLILVFVAEDRLRRAAGRGWGILRTWLLRLAVAEVILAGAGFLLHWLMRG